MKTPLLIAIAGLTAACNGPVSDQSNHQSLDFEYCREIAQETARAGDLNYNLCPGYMPNGEKVELP
ncbi:hypothetical protein [Neptunicoccus cionae]|uniref:Uncharacterized protein n=1 Tax=Neptunicoccus cionae TaxID=2035344 RepID=A0A916VRP2_9RHOB|nr:hypothetical protein [Amylibacter cionae]GGA23388.1 hypothetical protein GCM10011498_25330 [Amylibacter cionae]